jgi:hypothetical protein
MYMYISPDCLCLFDGEFSELLFETPPLFYPCAHLVAGGCATDVHCRDNSSNIQCTTKTSQVPKALRSAPLDRVHTLCSLYGTPKQIAVSLLPRWGFMRWWVNDAFQVCIIAWTVGESVDRDVGGEYVHPVGRKPTTRPKCGLCESK